MQVGGKLPGVGHLRSDPEADYLMTQTPGLCMDLHRVSLPLVTLFNRVGPILNVIPRLSPMLHEQWALSRSSRMQNKSKERRVYKRRTFQRMKFFDFGV
jgi:hypothetical protein